MSKAETYFLALAIEVSDVIPRKIFGALCMKTPNGNSAAMFWKDNLVVKLTGNTLKEAMSFDGIALFEPIVWRPMNEWIQILFDYKTNGKNMHLYPAKV